MFVSTSAGKGDSVQRSSLRQEDYILKIANGDRAALSALYQETKASVYGFALSILKNQADAEDVLQDCFIKIWSAARGYRPLGKPMAWILTITRNLSTNILRERSKTADISEEDAEKMFVAEGPAVTTENRIVLETAMNLLSDEEQQIIMLHAVSGLKHIEISKLLSLPLSTVLSKYNRAKKKLQDNLKERVFQ